MSLEEMPRDQKAICTGRQEAGTCQAWFVPLLQLDLEPVPCVLERQSPCRWRGTDEVVDEYLGGLWEAGASAWAVVKAVPPGRERG